MHEVCSNETQIERVKRVMTWLRGNKRVNKRTRKRAVARQRDETDPISSIRSLSSRSQELVLLHLECTIPVLPCVKVIYNIRSLKLEQVSHPLHVCHRIILVILISSYCKI